MCPSPIKCLTIKYPPDKYPLKAYFLKCTAINNWTMLNPRGVCSGP